MSMASDAKEAAILRMLDFFQFSSKISDDQLSAYFEAVEDCSVEAVERSCIQFRTGKVEGRNPAFPPNAVEFAMNVRQWDNAIATVTADRMLAQSTKLIPYKAGEEPPPPSKPLGPIKMEVDGIMRDTSTWTFEQKEEALRTGKLPESIASALPDAAQQKRIAQ